jgi:hypothetical protein
MSMDAGHRFTNPLPEREKEKEKERKRKTGI